MARKKTPPEYGESDYIEISINQVHAWALCVPPRFCPHRSESASGELCTYRTHDGSLPVELLTAC